MPFDYHYFVKTKEVTPEVRSAMSLLANIDDDRLMRMENALMAELGMFDAAREEGLEKGLEKGREEGAAIGASRMAFSTMMEDFVEYGDIKIRKSAKLMPTTESELKKIWTGAGLNDDKFDEFISELKKQKGDLIASDEEMK